MHEFGGTRVGIAMLYTGMGLEDALREKRQKGHLRNADIERPEGGLDPFLVSALTSESLRMQ
jgi:hypothetical protein